MSFLAETDTILARFKSVWTGGDATIDHANVEFTRPAKTVAWARVRIRRATGSAFQASMAGAGSRRFRHPGTIVVQLFVPEKEGLAEAETLGDTIADGFRGVAESGIVYQAPDVRDVGSTGDGWYQVNVEIPFYRDSQH